MGHWFMEILTGIFSIWNDDPFDEDWRRPDPLASV
jgi:hypothetical protein